MVDDMLQHVPEDRFDRFAAEVLVFDLATNTLGPKSAHEVPDPSLLTGPAGTQVLHRLEILRREMCARRIALPAGAPHRFCRHNVREGVADRAEAVPEILMELLSGQPLDRIEQPVASPIVKVQQVRQRFRSHAPSISDFAGLAKPSRRGRLHSRRCDWTRDQAISPSPRTPGRCSRSDIGCRLG